MYTDLEEYLFTFANINQDMGILFVANEFAIA